MPLGVDALDGVSALCLSLPGQLHMNKRGREAQAPGEVTQLSLSSKAWAARRLASLVCVRPHGRAFPSKLPVPFCPL